MISIEGQFKFEPSPSQYRSSMKRVEKAMVSILLMRSLQLLFW